MRIFNSKRILICLLFQGVLLGGFVNAQDKVRGSVVDALGYPIPGAAVTTGNITATTDDQGTFLLPPAKTIKIVKMGYQSVVINNFHEKVVVRMEEDPLQQEISVPYEEAKSFSLISAVSTIKGEDLKDQFVSNIGAILAGKLAGLTVMQGSGEPYMDTPESYHIRGIGSFNIQTPKIYVDGFEASIDHLNPMEIESVSVLKDAGALTQLGINGANGAIWVTTKRGEKGQRISVNIDRGMQEITIKPQFANAYQYASLYNEALSNDKGTWTQFYSDEKLSAYKNGNDGKTEDYDLLYPNVNWYDEVLKSFAPATNANVSFSGGNDRSLYYLMMGYQNIDGLYKDTDKKRNINSNINSQKFNYRANIDVRLSDIFSIATTIGGNISDRFTPSFTTSTLWNNMMSYPANAFPVKTPKGYGGTAIYRDNPKASVLETGFVHYHYRNIQATLSLNEDLNFITRGLKFSQTLSLYNNESQTYRKSKDYQRFEPFLTSGGVIDYNVIGTQETDFTIVQEGNSYNNLLNRINTELSLMYNRNFDKHQLHGSVVYHADKYVTAGTQVPLLTRGFVGRLNYNYDQRYLAELGYAFSGMSPYSPDHNIGFFPSLSLGWIASDEGYLKGNKTINYLKVRGSIGLVGMPDLTTANNYFMYQQYYKNGNTAAYFGTQGTSRLSTLYEYYIANKNASWEKSLKANIGTDIQLFNSRLTATVDLFYENRYDILTTINVLGYTGIASDANFNSGIVVNKGFETDFTWRDKIGNFSYYFNPRITFSRNKIVEMNEAPVAYDYSKKTGTKIGVYNCLIADGLFKSWDEINDPSTPVYMYGDIQPGDIKYVDKNKDGNIDDNDKAYINDRYQDIPEINLGINFGLFYKGFDLTIYGYGMAHRTISIMNRINGAFINGTGNLSMMALNNRWAYYPDQGIDTRQTANYPRLSVGSNTNNWMISTFWLRSGDFFRISNVSLGFTLPKSLTGKIDIEKIRLYIAATNLLLFDNLDMEDIEGQVGDYPLMKTFKIGLNLNF